MPDLYETLGVARDATPDEIRAAARKAASAAHPDRAGGSDEAMAAVNKARDVLLDPARRQAYDTSGATGEPVTVEARAEQMLREYLTAAIDDAGPGDVLTDVERLLRETARKCDAAAAAATKATEKLLRRRDKISTPEGVRNLAHEIIDAQVAAQRNVIRVAAETSAAATCAGVMLQAYSTSETKPVPPTFTLPAADQAFVNAWMQGRR